MMDEWGKVNGRIIWQKLKLEKGKKMMQFEGNCKGKKEKKKNTMLFEELQKRIVKEMMAQKNRERSKG